MIKRALTEADYDMLASGCQKLPKEYQWLRETPVAVVEENEMPQWGDPEELWRAVTAMGTTHVRYPAIGWAAHFFGESTSLPKYPAMRPDEDWYGDVCRCFHQKGGKVMAYNHFGGVMYMTVAAVHPDWICRDKDGFGVRWNNMHYIGCLSGDGFIDAQVNAIREHCEKYGTDSVYLDAPTWYSSVCYCDNCRALYRGFTGEDMPDEIVAGSPEYRKWCNMRIERMANIIQNVHAVTDSCGIPLIINARGHRKMFASGGDKELNILFCEGANAGEGYRPQATFWSMAKLWRLGEAEKKVSLAYCPTGPFDNFRSYGTDETAAVGMGSAMFGMTPMLESATSYLYDTTGGAALREVCRNLRDHTSVYYRTEPVHDVAVISDENALSEATEEQYKLLTSDMQGLFEALVMVNRQFEYIFDEQLSDKRLKGYRAVILPITSKVSPRMEGILRRFAEEGGVVIAGCEFSGLNENGSWNTEVLAEQDDPAHTPAAVSQEYAAGKIIRLGFRPGIAFRNGSELTGFLRDLIDYAVGVPLYAFDTSGAVLSFMTEDDTARYLHLVNYTGANMERSIMVDRIAPLYDIDVTVREIKTTEIYTLYGRNTIPFHTENGRICFRLDKLNVYETIVMKKG